MEAIEYAASAEPTLPGEPLNVKQFDAALKTATDTAQLFNLLCDQQQALFDNARSQARKSLKLAKAHRLLGHRLRARLWLNNTRNWRSLSSRCSLASNHG